MDPDPQLLAYPNLVLTCPAAAGIEHELNHVRIANGDSREERPADELYLYHHHHPPYDPTARQLDWSTTHTNMH